jgi:hypothetical protein
MAESGVLIDGQRVNIPGVYPEVNVEGMNPPSLGFTGIVGVVAPSDGGLPDTIYTFRNYNEAKAVLRGGRILSYLSRMFQPSSDINGAREVRFIRGNASAVRASYDWLVGGGGDYAIFTAMDSGAWTNGIRISSVLSSADSVLITDRESSPVYYVPKVFTVKNVPDKKTYAYTFKNGINLVAPAGSVFTVDSSERTINLSTNATVVDETTFDEVPTFEDLVAWINRHTGWVATCIGAAYYPTETLNDNASAAPDVANLAIFYPAETGLLVYLLNTQNPAISAVLGSEHPSPLVALSEAPLTGGVGKGTDKLTTPSLTAALTLAETTSMHLMWIQSSNPALQALLMAHCAAMSTDIARKYRIAVMGINFTATSPYDEPVAGASSFDAAIALAIANVQALDGPGVYCLNGSTWANPVTGIQEQLGGLGLAAQVVGMKSGALPGIPITNKTLHSTGLEFPNITDAQKSLILDNCITTIFRNVEDMTTNVLQAITTRQSVNPMVRTFHGMYICHEIARMEIAVLSKFIGSPLDLSTGQLIKGAMGKALDRVISSGSNPAGYLTEGRLFDGTRVPAWEGLTVSGDSTTGLWTIRVNPHPIGETDFILVVNNLTPAPIEL